jgi:hypothetical protein
MYCRHQRGNLAGEQIGQTWTRAAIRHVREIGETGAQFEQFAGQMVERAVAGRAV